MPKKKIEPEVEYEELADNEEFISRDDIDIEVRMTEGNTVMVQFSGFDGEEVDLADLQASIEKGLADKGAEKQDINQEAPSEESEEENEQA